jgi:hypothetical protein
MISPIKQQDILNETRVYCRVTVWKGLWW